MTQDLWDTSFGRHLPSAIEDRLTARSLSLRGLDAEEARKLVDLRMREAGLDQAQRAEFVKFLDLERFFLGRPLGSVSARGLLRHAAERWRLLAQSEEDHGTSHASSGTELLWDSNETAEDSPMPTFDIETEDDLKRMAETLAHDAKGEQVEVSKADLAPDHDLPPVNIVPMISAVASVIAESFLPAPAPEAPPEFRPAPPKPALVEALPPNNFHRLRQMLAKIKVATDSVPMPDATPPEQTGREAAAKTEPVKPALHVPPPNLTSAVPTVSEGLLARFEILRNEFAQNAVGVRVDCQAINDLVRLAGKRFAVVHFDEVELPGLLGRSLPRWSLQGMEIVFGLENFSDERYWKTVSSFVAGRIAELTATTAAVHETAPQLKLVVFKSDLDGEGLAALIKDEIIPPSVRLNVDTVHVEPRTLASIQAMRQLIREAEAGQLSTKDPTAVLGALASELDFFWKRLIRPR